MAKNVPITAIAGIELVDTRLPGVSKVVIAAGESEAAKGALSWDRYVRLSAAASAISEFGGNGRVLDVGGFDGALALFLPGREIDLIDPATTGASLLNAPPADGSYEVVVAVDVLEHIEPTERTSALEEMARMARNCVVLNYPHQGTRRAQELVYRLTGHSLIKDHAEWELPDTQSVLETMAQCGFKGHAQAHSSLAVWVGQYLTMQLAPQASSEMNKYLIDQHRDEPQKTPLYDLVILERQEL